MLVQFKDPTVVKTQPFPNRVAALHRRIERTDPGLVPMHKLTIDINDQVAVLGIKFLQHESRKIELGKQQCGKALKRCSGVCLKRRTNKQALGTSASTI